MGQAQRVAAQRFQDDPAAMPLPSFEMPWVEAVDPDRTLKRPALRLAPQANKTEEISADDVLEVVRVGDAIGTAPVPSPPRSTPVPLHVLSYPTPLITVVAEPSVAPRPAPAIPPPALPASDRADLACLAELAHPPSSPPVALDVGYARSRADSTFLLDDTPAFRTPRMGLAIAAGLGAMVGVLVLVFALGSAGAKSTTHRQPSVTTKAPAPAAASTAKPAGESATSATPTVDVASLPRAPVGTVSLATNSAQHRLFVDGALVKSGTTVVSCGKHLVKVGSKGRTQQVDVPCGTDVVVGN